VQHNPLIADGIEGFRAFLGFLKATFPELRGEIKKVLAEGDYVILHAHGLRARPTRLSDHRHLHLENGKIVEHWDVLQPIPESALTRAECFDVLATSVRVPARLAGLVGPTDSDHCRADTSDRARSRELFPARSA
jgi:hypothetical protein